MAVPVTLFLVLFVPALLILFTCLVSCFMMLSPKRLPQSDQRKKPAARQKPPLSLSIGAGGAVESNFDGPSELEAGLSKPGDLHVNAQPSEEPPADERSSMMSLGALLSDGSRAGTPRGDGQRTPKSKVKTPRGFGRSSPRIPDRSPRGGLLGSSSASVPELEIVELVELPLLESGLTEGQDESGDERESPHSALMP